MNPETNLRALSSASVSPQLNQSPSESILDESSARHRTSAFGLIPCAALAIAALALAADATAQQPYPGAPNDNPPQAGQYAQPAPQNGYAPPQYQAPQYQPPATQNQPYPDQQRLYAPQDSAPQQPYAPQPYTDQSQAPGPYSQPDQSQAPTPSQSLSAQDLEQLLAPIALYPDALLAQILAASTYPAEVAIADQWVDQMRAAGYGSPDQIAAGANAQTNWDPSVKALTAFPDVLDMMNHDLEWTTNLGNAYYNQPQDVMQTVQVLRQRAEQAGNLQSTPQEEVQNDQGYIDLAPTNPQVVYVPTYNPWDVYGQPIAPYPGFSLFGALGNFFGATPIQYGLSFALGAFDRMPFGWLAWGLDWLGHAILFDHSGYYTHSNTVADWGLPRGGPRAYGRGDSWGMRDGQNRYSQRQSYDRGGNDQRGGWSNNRGGGGLSPTFVPRRDSPSPADLITPTASCSNETTNMRTPRGPRKIITVQSMTVRGRTTRVRRRSRTTAIARKLIRIAQRPTRIAGTKTGRKVTAIRAPVTATLAGPIMDTRGRKTMPRDPASLTPTRPGRIEYRNGTTREGFRRADIRAARMRTMATRWRGTSTLADSIPSVAGRRNHSASALQNTPTRRQRVLVEDTRALAEDI